MIFAVTREVYPNGSEYLDFRYEGKRIGTAVVAHGGYLVSGKRKAVCTLNDAARQMTMDRIKILEKDISFWRNAYTKML